MKESNSALQIIKLHLKKWKFLLMNNKTLDLFVSLFEKPEEGSLFNLVIS